MVTCFLHSTNSYEVTRCRDLMKSNTDMVFACMEHRGGDPASLQISAQVTRWKLTHSELQEIQEEREAHVCS